jgi:hypothetical protein
MLQEADSHGTADWIREISIHPVSFPELTCLCQSTSFTWIWLRRCDEFAKRIHLDVTILSLIYKAIGTMNLTLVLNSLSGYLLTICNISASTGLLLPLYFIIPATYIIDRT